MPFAGSSVAAITIRKTVVAKYFQLLSCTSRIRYVHVRHDHLICDALSADLPLISGFIFYLKYGSETCLSRVLGTKRGRFMSRILPDEELKKNPAVNLAWVLAEENSEIEKLCAKRNVPADLNHNGDTGATPARFAVAFSGGGIRSAAVNLGVIQALAKKGLLRQLHYMSGISGGGYILGWLTSWIRRSGFDTVEQKLRGTDEEDSDRQPGTTASVSLSRVQHNYHERGVSVTYSHTDLLTSFFIGVSRLSKRLSRTTLEQRDGNGQSPSNRTLHRFVEPQPIRHLRDYAAYLAPRTGLGSGDTLAMISIYLRNVLLNLTMIICLLAGIVAAAQMLTPPIAWQKMPVPLAVLFLAIMIVAAALSGLLSGRSVDRLAQNERPVEGRRAGLYTAVLTLTVATCTWLLMPQALLIPALKDDRGVYSLMGLGSIAVGVIFLTGWLRDTATGDEVLGAVQESWLATLTGVLASIGFVLVCMYGFEKWLKDGGNVRVSDWFVMLGLPAILVMFALTSYIDLGIAGNSLPDAKREWLGRLAGYYLYFAVIAALVMMAALRGPVWMDLLFGKAGTAASGGKWLKWILPGGWLFTVAAGLYAGRSPKTGDGTGKPAAVLHWLAMVAPPVFLAGVFLLVSWGVHATTFHFAGLADNGTFGKWLEHKATQKIDSDYLSWPEKDDSVTTSLFVVETQADRSTTLRYQKELNGTKKSRIHPVAACMPQPCPRGPEAGTSEQSKGRFSVMFSLLAILLLAFAISGLLMTRLNANEFSMHLFYRNRLVRTFLGASNVPNKQRRGRVPSPFTGFALDDDVPLQELSTGWQHFAAYHSASAKERERDSADHIVVPNPESEMNGEPQYDGPYPIWGTALNLTSGEDLAWQTRKAACFIYSPLYCGWDLVPSPPQEEENPDDDSTCRGEQTKQPHHEQECLYGYRGTGAVTSDGEVPRIPYTGHASGPSIGNAMAASGAAISPNCGYHSRPAVAALLALFNLRVGWWTGNPRRQDAWNLYAPGAYYLITKELMGKTDDCARYVYLSDGGHFENLGIYELVRRRVKYILACDASEDPNYYFDDLANAVEKCRRDFGVEIKIKPSAIRPGGAENWSKKHFAVGAIHYPEVNGMPREDGILLYVKSSLTGHEPADVLFQKSERSEFPHDPTLKQFFSETQFEAYRALGEFMITEIWDEFVKTCRPAGRGAALLSQPVPAPANTSVADVFTYLEKEYAQ